MAITTLWDGILPNPNLTLTNPILIHSAPESKD